ncbi:hypothetical protein DDW05_02665 [Candidatus Nanobsidianus stetteri]|uniref:Uncharacterized protein n=1 Tax=Nanobsidianus stetteri TaxID=1294122 RepID=A0A2T9WRU6_NANST|nr:hypothetical protein DDW05_02665 [Candidatus Nanobsidianus stetteri]
MTIDKYGLYDIIKDAHKEFKEYLKRTGIEIKGVRLRVLESSKLLSELSYMIKTYNKNKLKQKFNTIDKILLEQISNDDEIYIIKEDNLRDFYIGEIYLLKQIYNTDDINELNKKILENIIHSIEKGKPLAIGVPETKEIYIIKDRLEKSIDETLYRVSHININGPSIIRLESPIFNVASAPLYTDGKNIKKDIAKAIAVNVKIHEEEHFIFNIGELTNPELSVSALQYITYIDMYNLLKYSKTYEIIEENIIKCKNYILNLLTMNYFTVRGNLPKKLLKDYINELRRASYDLGYCYASIIIDNNKESSCLNIKDVIKEVRNLSTLDAVTKITYY